MLVLKEHPVESPSKVLFPGFEIDRLNVPPHS